MKGMKQQNSAGMIRRQNGRIVIDLKARRKVYPKKQTVNLIYRDKDRRTRRLYLAAFFIFLIFLGIFSKFLVVDRLNLVFEAQKSVLETADLVTELKNNNKDYEDVLKTYEHYYASEAVSTQLDYADAVGALDLLEKSIMNQAKVLSVDLNRDTLSVQLTGVDLNSTSKLMASLGELEAVKNVDISTVNSGEDASSVVYLTISLQTEGGQ